jgi:hypothetical protein
MVWVYLWQLFTPLYSVPYGLFCLFMFFDCVMIVHCWVLSFWSMCIWSEIVTTRFLDYPKIYCLCWLCPMKTCTAEISGGFSQILAALNIHSLVVVCGLMRGISFCQIVLFVQQWNSYKSALRIMKYWQNLDCTFFPGVSEISLGVCVSRLGCP